MLRRIIFAAVILFVLVSAGQTQSYAWRGEHKSRSRDCNEDGVVDKKERHLVRKSERKKYSKADNWWQSRADVNEDGKVDETELSVWKNLEKTKIDLNGDGLISAKEQRLCWRHARSRVNTVFEKKHDVNRDGWLQPEEVKTLLEDRCALIKTNGKAKVGSFIEKEYDADNNGIISAEEAESISEDLQEF